MRKKKRKISSLKTVIRSVGSITWCLTKSDSSRAKQDSSRDFRILSVQKGV